MSGRKGMVVVLSGFSGAGKGTIMKHLLKKYPQLYHLSISATTRGIRQGEMDGREYFFKTTEEFEKMIACHELLEYARFNKNYYGTPKAYVEELVDQGKDVILEIEVQGALQIKKIFPESLLLFVTPPSAAVLKERLIVRGTETLDVIEQRLSIAKKESLLMSQYDYLVVNDVLDQAVQNVHHIIKSEHYHTSRNIDNIKSIQDDLSDFLKGDI